MTPFSHPAHRTGRADCPHPALGQELTPSSTARRAQACSDVRARSARRGAEVDRCRACRALNWGLNQDFKLEIKMSHGGARPGAGRKPNSRAKWRVGEQLRI